MVRFVVTFAVMTLLLACGEPSGSSEEEGAIADTAFVASEAPNAAFDPTTRFVNAPKGIWPLLDLQKFEELIQGETKVLLIDLSKEKEFVKGHIPGAQQMWRDDITSRNYPYTGMALEPEYLADRLDSIGADSNTHFVIYDAFGGCEAARLWWLLNLYGYESASILDGGLQAWQVSGKPLEIGPSDLGVSSVNKDDKSGEFQLSGTLNAAFLATRQEVEEGLAKGQIRLLDTRSFEEFNGDVKKNGAFSAGHIPGGLHYDWGNAVEMTNSWKLKDNAVLQADLERLGITPDVQIVTYCHSGVRSAHTTFVLRELLGYPNVKNYDGSWTEWSYFLAEHQP